MSILYVFGDAFINLKHRNVLLY